MPEAVLEIIFLYWIKERSGPYERHIDVANMTPALPNPKFFTKKMDKGILKRPAIIEKMSCNLIFPTPLTKVVNMLAHEERTTNRAMLSESTRGIFNSLPTQIS